MMSTHEVAEYLGVHEKQVYALVKRGAIPATRVTGKYVFPRRLVDEWIESAARRAVRSGPAPRRLDRALVAAGSDDVALERLQGLLLDPKDRLCLFLAPTGSRGGLTALAEGIADLAFCHLLDPATGEYTLPFVRLHLAAVPAVVVTLLHREVGLVVPRGNPKRIRAVADLARAGVRLVNRQAGSGTRALLDARLAEAGVPASAVAGYRNEVRTHLDVGTAVVGGRADAGVAEAAVARLLDLDFVPLTRERFDAVIPKAVYFEPAVQRLLEVTASRRFRTQVQQIGGYDTEGSGRVVFAAP